MSTTYTPLNQDPIAFGDWFLRLPKHRKKIVEYLFHLYQEYGDLQVWPAVKSIARFAKCSERNVFFFFREVRQLGINVGFQPFKILARYKQGQQTSNDYRINPYFKLAYFWLKKKSLLNVSYDRIDEVISSMRKSIKEVLNFTPPKPQTSPYTDSSLKGSRNTIAPIFLRLRNTYIPIDAQKYLQKNFSEHILVQAIESLDYALKMNKVKKSPQAYLIGTAKKLKFATL